MPAEISILLPFHHSSDTLQDAVNSILRQTIESWELILIDNNGDAESRKTAETFARQEKRIKIVHEPQQGIAFALNTGLEHCAAEIIARMDADDIMHPVRLEQQLRFMQKNSQVGLVSCRCTFSSDSDQAEGYRHFVDWQNAILTPDQHFLNRFVESPIAHPSVMFRKELIEKYGKYDTGPVPEDYELWLRWMSHGVAFAKVDEELLHWRDRQERLSRTSTNYSEDAFFKVKIKYLVQWLKSTLHPDRKIIICGTGKKSRRGAEALQNSGLPVHAFTDVKHAIVEGHRFFPVEELRGNRYYFFISFIAKRGVGLEIRKFLKGMDLEEGKDFLLAG